VIETVETDCRLDWGLLWFDGSDEPLHRKVQGAATYYRTKHGQWPDLCYVHPSACERDGVCDLVDKVAIVARESVLPHHFWIGVEKEKNDGHE